MIINVGAIMTIDWSFINEHIIDSHYFCRVVIKISNIITTEITIVTTTDTTIIVDSDLVCFSN